MRGISSIHGWCAGLLIAALSLLGAHPARAQSWEEISSEEGITVWQREVAGTSLVEFRGRGLVKASIQRIAAVLRDQEKKTEWMANCVGNGAIQYHSTNRIIVYNRTGSPAFFISDRDVVLDTNVEFLPEEKTLHISFKNTQHPKKPPVDGVVRMPKLKGFWRLVYKGPDSTEVTYQVQADPGGALPKWLVNWASKGLPFNTLKNLRTQVTKPGYDKELMIVEASFDWERFIGGAPAPAPSPAPAPVPAPADAAARPVPIEANALPEVTPVKDPG